MEEDPWANVSEAPTGLAPPAPVGAASGLEEASVPVPRPRDVNKPLYFKHFNRKSHLNYNYLYDYRHSYYDDVIKYLDARQRFGLHRQIDIPRPQTWAERALRTYPERIRTATECSKDNELLSRIRTSNNAYYYHAREYVNRRHSGTYL